MSEPIKTVALKKICKVDSGAGFPLEYQGRIDQDYPFFKVGDMNSPGNEQCMMNFQHTVSESIRKKLNAIAFPAGTIIFPKIGAAIATNKKRILQRPSCVDNNVMALVPSHNIDGEYLFYLLLNTDLSTFASTGNPPSIRKSTIQEWKVLLPSLDEQKRIATILAKADRLRRLRRFALAMSGDYLQAVFLEMFGDPVTNPMGLPAVLFGEVCETRLGKMLDAKQQTGENKRPYLRNVNVQWSKIDLSDLQEMDFDEREREILRLKKGDVLICEGGEVGRAAIWNDELLECYYQKALHRARPNPKKAIPEYILWLMKCLADYGGLGDFTSQVTIAHLTGVKLKQIEFPLPPLKKQQQFTQIVHQYERLRTQQREALRQAEHLFQTLLHQAFNDEL